MNPRYGNRHAGDYTIRDDAGAIRGRFTSSGATADSFFAEFSAPFSTDKLTVGFTVTGARISADIRRGSCRCFS